MEAIPKGDTMENEKWSAIKLIREFFAPVTMDEMKALTGADRLELASGIARERGLKQDDLQFTMVTY